MMSQWNKTSISSQTDNSNPDMPSHKIPEVSGHIPQRVEPITARHARQVFSPLEPAAQGDCGQDVCVCIACHTRCRNDTALRKHGAREDHRPYACVCGKCFARLDALRRHIESKNKVTKFHCPLCTDDGVARVFSRADHLHQHLKTSFHKSSTGKTSERLASNVEANRGTDNSMHPPQSTLLFPCLIQGCTRTGEFAYLRQIDLDEHVLFMHGAPQLSFSVQQPPSDPAHIWPNYDLPEGAYLYPVPAFGPDAAQSSFMQLGPAGGYQGGWGENAENNVVVRHPNPQPNAEFDVGVNFDFNI